MAFPASTARLAHALENAYATALRIKQQTQQLRTLSAAGPTERRAYIALAQQLHGAITTWGTVAALPGIAAYAQAQWGSDQIDVAAEFAAMRAAAVTLRDWILSVFPRDAGTGAFLVSSYDTVTGAETPLTFTAAQTATFRTNADALIGAIA
jgi:hypothetical protein